MVRLAALSILALMTGVVPGNAHPLGAWHPPQPASVGLRPSGPLAQFRRTRRTSYAQLPLAFEANRGQTNSSVKYLARGPGYTAFLTSTKVVLHFQTTTEPPPTFARLPDIRSGPIISLHPLGGISPRSPAALTALDRLPGKVNYFIGNDPRKWRTDIPTYARVEYHDVYPGVDLVYDGAGGHLDYSWVVGPGAVSSSIRLQITGPRSISIDRQGSLIMRGPHWSLTQPAPTVYQIVGGDKRFVSGRYVLGAHWLGFALAPYDKRAPLTIDPGLGYSSYLGGEGDQGLGIAVDRTGSAYVTGFAGSRTFPTARAVQAANQGQMDAFVSKLNPAGNALVYSTYLGGKDADEAIAVAVDSSGSAYITGDTYSLDFPTVHAVQSQNRSTCISGAGSRGRCNDAFVAKLSPTGNALVYSTYLGGDGGDAGNGIAVDGAGDAYITGETDSSNFPTANARQPHKKRARCVDEMTAVLASCSAAFVTKFSPSGTSMLYSTYLGGSHNDGGYDIAVDRAGDAYVTGYTASSDFPTVHPIQRTLAGIRNAFATKIDPSGKTLVYSTYLGGRLDTLGIKIAVDSQGSAYVTGWTRSPNFPIVNALQRRLAPNTCSCIDAFVSKINPSGTALDYSTYLGGSGDDEALGIAVDAAGDAYIAGDTDSRDFPTFDALQARSAGGNEAFVSKIDPAGQHLLYSTYLGGSQDDYGHGVAVDRAGNAYVTGFTYSTDFPTHHALQPSPGGVFITKIGTAPLTRRASASGGKKCQKSQGLRRGMCPRTAHKAIRFG